MRDYAHTSFWLATAGPAAPVRLLAGDLRVDVAIIGGGYTGLSTAYHLCSASPGLRVAVLERGVIGSGSSGRNAGFSRTVFGLEPGLTKAIFGAQRTRDAYEYLERAVDSVQALIREHDLQSDYEHPGFFRVATSPAAVRNIQHDLEVLAGLGVKGMEWVDGASIRAEVDSPRFLGGWWEPRCGLLNPAKHARELQRIAQACGALVYEQTPVEAVERGPQFRLRTPSGVVVADKIVFATNAYSHLFPQLRSRQTPIFTHMVVTEPLTAEQLASIGWHKRQGMMDARNFSHYFRLTADNRVAIGGSDISLAYGKDMQRDLNSRTFAALERQLVWFFPGLDGIRFTHRWGGPVSITLDLAPVIGKLGDERAWFSLGCVGHGVPMAHLNGHTLADLLLERKTDLTDIWLVDRRMRSWPPEPLRMVAGQAVRGVLRWMDARNGDKVTG